MHFVHMFVLNKKEVVHLQTFEIPALETETTSKYLKLIQFPGSPLTPTKNKYVFIFHQVRGEPGNEAKLL